MVGNCRAQQDPLGSIRFGRFELSAETGELRKDGVRQKLSGQAIQVLEMLLACPGKLVTREQLQQSSGPAPALAIRSMVSTPL